MSAAPPFHRSRVLASPWPGVHGVALESGRSFARHFHATWGVGLLEQGAHRSASGRGPVDAQAGDILTCNPGEVHDGHPLGDGARRWRMLHLTPAALDELFGPDARTSDFVFERPVLRDPPLQAALRRLFDWLDGLPPAAASGADPLQGETLLACMAAHMGGLGRIAGRLPTWPDAPLSRVHERLADLSAPTPTLAELAVLAGLDKYRLLRHFSHAYGMPPHAWRLQRRIEQARRLIADGHGLSSAAAAAGFADQSHMTRLFSRQFGFTPASWQRAATRAAQ